MTAVASREPMADAFELSIEVSEREYCGRSLRIGMSADYMNAARAAVLRKYASRVKMRGFRKGRAPVQAVLGRYRDDIAKESFDLACENACRQAIESKRLRPLTEVEIGETRRTGDGGVSFVATFEVAPTVRVERVGGFRVERPRMPPPTEEAVDRVLAELRAVRTEWHPAEGRPGLGDLVDVQVAERRGGEARNYEIELGKGEAIPDIEEAISTLLPGESGEFDIVFPDDHPDENRAGTRHAMRIALHRRRIARPPEIDDDFARSMGAVEDLADMRAKIAEGLVAQARQRADEELRTLLLREVVAANPFDVPASMVDAYVDDFMGNLTDVPEDREEGLREQLRPSAERVLRQDLMARAVAEKHNLEATHDEVNARIADLARRENTSPSAVRSRLRRREGGLDQLRTELTLARVFEFLKEQSEII